MNDFYKQDVFFFVTTIAVVIFTVIVVVAAVYVIDILRTLKYISRRAKTETDLISEDLNDLRHNVRQKGLRIRFFSNFFNKLYKKHK